MNTQTQDSSMVAVVPDDTNAAGVGSFDEPAAAPRDALEQLVSPATASATGIQGASTASAGTYNVASSDPHKLTSSAPSSRRSVALTSSAPSRRSVALYNQRSLLPTDVSREIDILTVRESDENLRRVLRPASRAGGLNTKVVPKEAMLAYIEGHITRKRECLDVPFIIMYFILFCILLLVHERVPDVSQLEREFRGMLDGTSFEGYETIPHHPVSGHKTLDDIDTVTDIYTYLREAVLPLFLHDLNTTAPEDLYRVLSYSELIGGIQLQQVRKQRVNCAEYWPDRGPFNKETGANPFLANFDCFPDEVSSECYGPGEALEGFCPDRLTDQRSTPRRLSYWDYLTKPRHRRPRTISGLLKKFKRKPKAFSSSRGFRAASTASRASRHSAYSEAVRRLSRAARAAKSKAKMSADVAENSPGDIFSVSLMEHEGLQGALDRLDELRDNGWIDLQTAFVGIKLFVLHPDLGMYTSVSTDIYVAPSGEIVGLTEAITFGAEPFQRKWIIAIDVIWAVLWVELAWNTVHTLYSVCRSHVRDKVRDYFSDIFNVMEWAATAGGAGVLVFFLVYLDGIMALRDKALDVVLHRPSPGGTHTEEVMASYRESLRAMQGDVVTFGRLLELYRTCLSWYCVLLIFRFFKAFMSQPKLAVVTRTILACAPDFFHFAVVMMTAMLSFAVSGMFLFGHRLIYFSSIEMSLEVCCLFMLGSFDYEELADDWPETALFWMTAYMCSMFILILNMALAIIMDVYGAQSSNSSVQDSLYDQGETLVQDLLQSRGGMSNEELLRIVETFDQINMTKFDLRKLCPQLTDARAAYIIDKVEGIVTNDDNCELAISDAARLMVAIKSTLYDIAKQINQITESQRLTKEVCARQTRLQDAAGKGSGKKARPSNPLPVISLVLDDKAELRLRAVEAKLSVIEEFLNEGFTYVVFRGKEACNTLMSMEERLRSRRDDPGSADRREAGRGAGLDRLVSEPPPPALLFKA